MEQLTELMYTDWETFYCGVLFISICTTTTICSIIAFIGFVIDKLRERKAERRIISEKYIRYRINRWNRNGY